jgi:hypothetical protein
MRKSFRGRIEVVQLRDTRNAHLGKTLIYIKNRHDREILAQGQSERALLFATTFVIETAPIITAIPAAHATHTIAKQKVQFK